MSEKKRPLVAPSEAWIRRASKVLGFVFWSAILAVPGRALTACSSTPEEKAVFAESQERKNPYRALFETKKDADTLSDSNDFLTESAYKLFQSSLDVFLSDLSARAQKQSVLDSFPPVFIYGNADLLQTLRSGRPSFNHFEFSDWGPWWLDLVRIEEGAMVLAADQGLRLYHEGTCLGAFEKTLKEKVPFDDAALKFLTETKTVGTKEEVIHPLARFGLTKASPHSQSDHPLLESACARFTLAQNLFESAPALPCSQNNSKAIVSYPTTEEVIKSSSFTSEFQLESHVRSLCSRLAQMDLKQWTPFDVRSLQLALEKSPVLRARLLSLSRDEAHLLLTGYRMILQDSKKSNSSSPAQ